MGDLGILVEVPTLHCNSHSAIMLAKNPMFHAKTKNIGVKYHFIWDVLEDKHMELVKAHIDGNPTNLLTKDLAFKQFAHYCALMGMCLMGFSNMIVHTCIFYTPYLEAHWPLSRRLLGW